MEQGSTSGGRKREQRTRPGGPASAESLRPASQRSFVDVDPWAMLLEQLMDVPDDTGQGEPKTTKRK